jgi:hypothetical protein
LIFGDLGTLLIKGFLLFGLLHFLALELIANQCTGAQPQRAADRRPNPWMAHRRSYRPARGGAS